MKSLIKPGLIVLAVGILGYFIFGAIMLWVALLGFTILVYGLMEAGVDKNKKSNDDAKNGPRKGFSEGFTYSFFKDNTGIAVSTETKTIKLKDGKKVKEYSFVDVRKWETNLLSGGNVVAPGFAALGHNVGNAHRNKVGSGLFVQVKDIDNPEWRIAMLDKKDQTRWMEILRQTINES